MDTRGNLPFSQTSPKYEQRLLITVLPDRSGSQQWPRRNLKTVKLSLAGFDNMGKVEEDKSGTCQTTAVMMNVPYHTLEIENAALLLGFQTIFLKVFIKKLNSMD